MDDAYRVGANIRSVRKERRMTQRDLSEKSGTSTTQLSAYENGKQMPGLTTLANIAAALKVSLDRLYYGSSDEVMLRHTDNVGEAVVGCFVKLRELGVVTHVHPTHSMGGGTASIDRYNFEIGRLFSELASFDCHRSYYSDGDSYVEQIKDSVINEINQGIRNSGKTTL